MAGSLILTAVALLWATLPGVAYAASETGVPGIAGELGTVVLLVIVIGVAYVLAHNVVERLQRRFLVVSGDMRRSIDVRIDSPYPGTFAMRDLGSTTVSIWLGLIPIFVFGIPLMWLVRRQRTWRAARLAWERAQGVVTEGDKPTAF